MQAVLDLMLRCMRENPQERPTANQLVSAGRQPATLAGL